MSTMPWSRGTPSFTCTAIDRSRSVPNIRNRAVPSGMRICSSGFWNEPAAPFSLRMPITSNGWPRIEWLC